MPIQHTLCGRPIPQFTPRRVSQLFCGIAVFALVTLVFTLPSSIPGPSLSKFTDVPRISLPKLPAHLPSPSILNPFRPAAHAPPIQENSTSEEASWYSNWNWLSPFSSSVTLDENRSLLPPLPARPAVYTYYDHTLKKDTNQKAAENEILVTWRKAWWSHGFKPVILGPADTTKNPLCDEVQKLHLDSELQTEMARWLAWENMGTGILCHYLVLPMGAREDPLLSYLRRGDYPKLTRYKGLESGLFSGAKADITAALKAALENPDLEKFKDLIQAVPTETFAVDSTPEAIAFYDAPIVASKYAKVDKAVAENVPKGLEMLNQLMNAHLHNTWQNVFSGGIAVLKPLPLHMTAMIQPALELAQFLSQCPESPIPESCPPNRPKCKPCVASVPLKFSTPSQYRNSSTHYTIGTVPHPYTLTSLNEIRENINIRYIRRETARDQWLVTATKELLGSGFSAAPRVVKFKEAVASDYSAPHSIWFTAEKSLPKDLDWHFGFAIPRNKSDTGKSESPVPGPDRRPPLPEADPQDGPTANDQEVILEKQLLEKAKEALKSQEPEMEKVRAAIEAWNLADSEAWRFARAFLARSQMERLKWEEEEKKYAGGAGTEAAARQGLGRWFDSVRKR